MTIQSDSMSLVLAGRWNKYIFSPSWVSDKLFNTQEVQIEINLENLETPLRYKTQNVRFAVEPTKVIFTALEYDQDVFAYIEDRAKHLCAILSETPVIGFGINIEFLCDTIPESVSRLLSIPDTKYYSDNLLTIKNQAVTRKLDLGDRECNLSVTIEGSKIVFLYNFHTTVSSASMIASGLTGDILKCYQMAKDIMKNIYNLEVASEEG